MLQLLKAAPVKLAKTAVAEISGEIEKSLNITNDENIICIFLSIINVAQYFLASDKISAGL